MKRRIDLRSDTVTAPTDEMRRILATAQVGDAVYGEDPTVNRLEREAATLFGKEAAAYMPSGYMANQASILAHTRPGDTLLAGIGTHTVATERASTERLARVNILELGREGLFTSEDLERIAADQAPAASRWRLIVVENTVNLSGGLVFPLEEIERIAAFARRHGIALHLDGARLFNAVARTGIPAARWAALADTVSVCLSKGLGAPVGSLVCGSLELIQKVRQNRVLLGGGMRQAGLLAAAGLYALEHHVARLAEDHRNAERLALGLRELGLRVDPWPQTNIVNFFVENRDPEDFVRKLGEAGVLVFLTGPKRVRAVTHLDISASDIDRTLETISRLVK